MPRVDVQVSDELPASSTETSQADVWIVDAELLKNGYTLCQIFEGKGAPSRILMVSLDAPHIMEIRRYHVDQENAAAFLEDIILE